MSFPSPEDELYNNATSKLRPGLVWCKCHSVALRWLLCALFSFWSRRLASCGSQFAFHRIPSTSGRFVIPTLLHWTAIHPVIYKLFFLLSILFTSISTFSEHSQSIFCVYAQFLNFREHLQPVVQSIPSNHIRLALIDPEYIWHPTLSFAPRMIFSFATSAGPNIR
jgi:hypothetical protein